MYFATSLFNHYTLNSVYLTVVCIAPDICETFDRVPLLSQMICLSWILGYRNAAQSGGVKPLGVGVTERY